MDIRHPHPLIQEGLEVRDALVLANGDERLILKLNDLLAKVSLHGGDQIKLRGLIAQAKLS